MCANSKGSCETAECAGSPERSLLAYVISTIISWAGSNIPFRDYLWEYTINIFNKVVWLFTEYDVARGILKVECKTWEIRATSYSGYYTNIIYLSRSLFGCVITTVILDHRSRLRIYHRKCTGKTIIIDHTLQMAPGRGEVTNSWLSSLSGGLGKRCRPRSDAAERDIWSESSMFAYRNFIKYKIKVKKYISHPFNEKLTRPINNDDKVHWLRQMKTNTIHDMIKMTIYYPIRWVHFHFKGYLVYFFHFYLISDKKSYKQIVETRLIWVGTVCQNKKQHARHIIMS